MFIIWCHCFSMQYVLRSSRRMLLKVLCEDVISKVHLPTKTEIKFYQKLINDEYPLSTDVYAVANRLNIYLGQAGDLIIQDMFYNGCTHDHYVVNVFVSSPNGVIIGCTTNTTGAMHCSQICDWSGLYY